MLRVPVPQKHPSIQQNRPNARVLIVAVSVGQGEREIADRMDHGGHKAVKLPFVWDRHPWRLI
jgi:hypothetical protein